jgi:hypothetical protein
MRHKPVSSFRRKPESILVLASESAEQEQMDSGFRRNDGVCNACERARTRRSIANSNAQRPVVIRA